MINPEKVRQDFPIFCQKVHGHPLIYLDSAATAQKPQCVIDALTVFYATEYATVHRSVYEFAAKATQKYHAVREQVRNFLNAAFLEEIIFTKGTTESINLVASSFCKAFVQKGDEIIISEMEHHSNIVPWQIACQERGAHLKVIPIDEKGQLRLEEYKKLLNSRTKLVSIAYIANATGTHNPIEEMIALAHKEGARVFIDGAQSAAHMPVDVQNLDADFFAFSSHKACGPTGVGVLYGKKELLNQMPPYQSGGDMIEHVTCAKSTYQPLPLKFEAGTPAIAQVIGFSEALKYIKKLGLAHIADWEQKLLQDATDKLLAIEGLKIIGTAERKGAIISFILPTIHPLDLGTLLDAKGIAVRTGHLCAQPTMQHFNIPAVTRISFAPYNTLADIDKFISELRAAIKLLK